MKKLLTILLTIIAINVNSQLISLQVDSAGQVTSDSVYQFSSYLVSGYDWSLTIESDTCDSVIFSIGGSNYETNSVTHVYAFDPLTNYPDTFVRAANLDTINGVAVETKTYSGTDFPHRNAAIRVYKHATFKDTVNFKLLFFR